MKYLEKPLLLVGWATLFYVTHIVVMDWVRVLVYNAYGN